MPVVDLEDIRREVPLSVREVEEVVHVEEAIPHGPRVQNESDRDYPPWEVARPRTRHSGGRCPHGDPPKSGVAGELVAQRLQ